MPTQGPWTTSVGVDLTGFLASPLKDPTPHRDLYIFTHIPRPITYVNGIQASAIGISTFTIHCQVCTKITYPILDLANKLDIMLCHKWCYEQKGIISYIDEYVTFLYKDGPQVLRFDDSHTQTHAT